MTGVVGKAIVNILYHSPFNPKSSDSPDDTLVELAGELPPGKALDLGCGQGRNSIFLSRKGWDVTGVDLVADAVRNARRKAEEAGVHPKLVQGDVSELDGVGGGFDLLVDAGCFHGLPDKVRDRYVPAVTRAAKPGATMLLLGLAKHPVIKGVTQAELRRRFRGWEMEKAERVTAEEMLRYGDGSPLLRKAFEKGWFEPWRYRMKRLEGSPWNSN